MEKFDEAVIKQGKKYLNQGQFFLAHDLIFQQYEAFEKHLHDTSIISYRNSLELQQLAARVSIKVEDYKKALGILHSLEEQKHPIELIDETWGSLGSVYKNIWIINRKKATGKLAQDCYLHAFKKTGSHWTGINAATMTLILDKTKKKEVNLITNKVIKIVKKHSKTSKNEEDRYWDEATLGEAHILLGNFKEAENNFNNALKIYHYCPGKVI